MGVPPPRSTPGSPESARETARPRCLCWLPTLPGGTDHLLIFADDLRALGAASSGGQLPGGGGPGCCLPCSVGANHILQVCQLRVWMNSEDVRLRWPNGTDRPPLLPLEGRPDLCRSLWQARPGVEHTQLGLPSWTTQLWKYASFPN